MQKQISAGIIISCYPDFEDDPVSGECANLVPEQIGITCEGADSGTETIEMCREPIMQIVTAVPDLLYGEEDRVGGDAGYLGADKRDDVVKKNKADKKIKYNINRRPSSIKKLSRIGQYYVRKKEHEKSSVRCKVERVFAIVKKLFRYRKTRYRGLQKQTAKLNIMFA